MKQLMQLLRDNAAANPKPLALVRAEGATEASLYIYDVIDAYWGVSAKMVADAVASLKPEDTLRLHINSPGGDVFEARAMAANLRQFSGKVIAQIDSLAASAATTVALAADEIVMDPQGFFMIHNAWSIAIGDKGDMQDMATMLQKVDAGIVADYVAKTGQTPEQVSQWMDAETWFTAQEALDAGFVDSIAEPPAKASNVQSKRFNLKAFARTPSALLEAPPPAPAQDQSAILAANQRRLRLLEIA
jgi:ATP-dependent protease ClpP protease subunit